MQNSPNVMMASVLKIRRSLLNCADESSRGLIFRRVAIQKIPMKLAMQVKVGRTWVKKANDRLMVESPTHV